MNKDPKNLQRQCVWWEIMAMSMLVFLAVYSIVAHSFNLTGLIELLMSVAGTCMVLWCMWVIRTFRNMLGWWADIKYNVDTACDLLHEAKQDIKEIKFINQSK